MNRLFAVLLTIAPLLSGCVLDEELDASTALSTAAPPAMADNVGRPRWAHELIVAGLYDIDLDGAEADPDGICACDSTECMEDWLLDTVGCDVCVSITCDDGPRHACTQCEPPPGPAPDLAP